MLYGGGPFANEEMPSYCGHREKEKRSVRGAAFDAARDGDNNELHQTGSIADTSDMRRQT